MRSVPWCRWPRHRFAEREPPAGPEGGTAGPLPHAKRSSAAFCFCSRRAPAPAPAAALFISSHLTSPLLSFAAGPLSPVSRPVSQPAGCRSRPPLNAALHGRSPWPAIAPASHLVVATGVDGRGIWNHVPSLLAFLSCALSRSLTFSISLFSHLCELKNTIISLFVASPHE